MFKKSERFLPENISKHVKNLQLFPIWSPNDIYFIFKKEEQDGYHFFLYDLKKNSQDYLLNPQHFADEVKNKLGQEINPSALPIKKIKFMMDEIVRIWLDDSCWDYHFNKKNFVLLQDKKIFHSDHYPSMLELLGFIPSDIHPNLQSPDKRWDLSCRDNNLLLLDHSNEKEHIITFGGRASTRYGRPPDSNLASITLQNMGIDLPPIAIWSPDSKKIITFQCDQVSVENLVLLQHAPKDGTFRPKAFVTKIPFVGDKFLPEINLCLIDVVSRQLTKIEDKPLRPALIGSPFEAGYIWWNEQSTKVYFLREVRDNHSLSLCVLDIYTKQVSTIYTEESTSSYVETSELLFWPNFTKVIENKNVFIWLSDKSGWPHLYLHDLPTGRLLHPITKGHWSIRKVFHVDNDWIYFLASGREQDIDPYLRFLYRAKLDGSAIELLTKEPADHTISFSIKCNFFIDNFSTMTNAPKTKLYNKNGGELQLLMEADFSDVYKHGYTHPESFCVKGADDQTDIYGLIYLPSDFDPSKKYPVIDDVYPGPHLTRCPKTYCYDPPEYLYGSWWSQALAELGFIVLNIDARGTPLRSKEFRLYSFRHFEKLGNLDGHVAAIKKLAERFNYMDLNRVGIIGHSFGGYAATRALLQHPDFFKAGVSCAGVQDLRTYLAFWGEKYQGLLRESDYNSQSNYPLAEKLQGKLLLIHGDLDDNVHPANTLQLVNALIKANKEFELLYVPNENHQIYFNNNYVKKKIWQFFVENLLQS